MTFPATIRAARLAAGLTQAELAALVGVVRDTVCKWERGVTKPMRLEPVADALGLKVTDLAAVALSAGEPITRRDYRSCKDCDDESECKRRVRLGLWVVCETPDADDLKFAEARGLV